MKRIVLITVALLAGSLPAYAIRGHVWQTHAGLDCLEFILIEDALAACPGYPGAANGSLNADGPSTMSALRARNGMGSISATDRRKTAFRPTRHFLELR
jgi:hypothetical protein